jgi:hypothetical protein
LVTQSILKQYATVPILGVGRFAAPVVRDVLRENGLLLPSMVMPVVSEDEFRTTPWGVAFLTEPYLSEYTHSGAVRPFIVGSLFAERVFDPWITAVMAVNADVARARPAVVRRLSQAFDRSIDFMNREPEAAARILATHAAQALRIEGIAPKALKCFGSAELPMAVIARQSAWLHQEGLTPIPDYADELPLTELKPRPLTPPSRPPDSPATP